MRSALAFTRVREFTPAAITALFNSPSPGWRAIGGPDSGQLRIRDGRGRFDVRELAIVDPPKGWWDTADIAGRLLLLVTGQPLHGLAGTYRVSIGGSARDLAVSAPISAR